MMFAAFAAKKGIPFSSRAFLQGIAAVAVIYLLAGGWFFFAGKPKPQQAPAQTVAIQHAQKKPEPAITAQPHAEAPVAHVEEAASVPVTDPHAAIDSHASEAASAAAPADDHHNSAVTAPAADPHAPAAASGVALDTALAAVPIEGLHETTADGLLPIVRKRDGLTPFKAYSRPFDRTAAEKPVISLAIMDLGLSNVATESAIRTMPPEVSLALSPYAENPQFWVAEARNRGHEVWMTLPLEPMTYPAEDTGPHTLMISAPEKQNQGKLSWILGRATGYVGFIAKPDAAMTGSAHDIRPVLTNIYNRGLGFVDSAEQPELTPQTMAIGQKAPYATVDIWIDKSQTREEIRAALKALEDKARENQGASGIIYPYPVSYQEILEWVKTLPEKGFILAPLSAQSGF